MACPRLWETSEVGLQPDTRMALQFQPQRPLASEGIPKPAPGALSCSQVKVPLICPFQCHLQTQALEFCLRATGCANPGCTTSTALTMHMEGIGLP